MRPIWADRTQMGPMLAPWTLLSGHAMLYETLCYIWACYEETQINNENVMLNYYKKTPQNINSNFRLYTSMAPLIDEHLFYALHCLWEGITSHVPVTNLAYLRFDYIIMGLYYIFPKLCTNHKTCLHAVYRYVGQAKNEGPLKPH